MYDHWPEVQHRLNRTPEHPDTSRSCGLDELILDMGWRGVIVHIGPHSFDVPSAPDNTQ